jgi:hypothetical protein
MAEIEAKQNKIEANGRKRKAYTEGDENEEEVEDDKQEADFETDDEEELEDEVDPTIVKEAPPKLTSDVVTPEQIGSNVTTTGRPVGTNRGEGMHA